MVIRDILNLFPSRIESENRVLLKDGRHEKENRNTNSNYWITDECTILYWLDNVQSCDNNDKIITFNFDKFNGFVNQKLNLENKFENENEWNDNDIVRKLTNEQRLQYIENLKHRLDLKFGDNQNEDKKDSKESSKDDDTIAGNDQTKDENSKDKNNESKAEDVDTECEGETVETVKDTDGGNDNAGDAGDGSSIEKKDGKEGELYNISVRGGTELPKNKFGLTAGSSFDKNDKMRGTYFTRFRKYIEMKHPLMKQILCDEKYKDVIKLSLKKYFGIEIIGSNPFEQDIKEIEGTKDESTKIGENEKDIIKDGNGEMDTVEDIDMVKEGDKVTSNDNDGVEEEEEDIDILPETNKNKEVNSDLEKK